MTRTISGRVAELGYTLEAAAAEGNLLTISGQISRQGGKPRYLGQLGNQISDADGVEAAKLSGLSILSQIAAATGDRLDRVARVVRLGVFVASTPDFNRQSAIANGASDLMVDVFGDAGRHARSAVGVASLPQGVAVEIEAVIALTPA